jgi:uncharacterized repeat protein (TIGR04042 family)
MVIEMPEMRFKIQWPDGSQEACYSPSLIIKKYFEPGQDYDLLDFVDRSRTALNIASDRVLAKYGRPCGLAIGQLATIEAKAARFTAQSQPIVRVLEFIE